MKEVAQSVTPYATENVEPVLREIWSRVLNLPDVDTDANFFDLGGTSLLMIRVHVEIKRRLERDISTNDLFAHPKIRDLVRLIQGDGAPDKAVETARQRGMRQRELMQRMRKSANSVT